MEWPGIYPCYPSSRCKKWQWILVWGPFWYNRGLPYLFISNACRKLSTLFRFFFGKPFLVFCFVLLMPEPPSLGKHEFIHIDQRLLVSLACCLVSWALLLWLQRFLFLKDIFECILYLVSFEGRGSKLFWIVFIVNDFLFHYRILVLNSRLIENWGFIISCSSFDIVVSFMSI